MLAFGALEQLLRLKHLDETSTNDGTRHAQEPSTVNGTNAPNCGRDAFDVLKVDPVHAHASPRFPAGPSILLDSTVDLQHFVLCFRQAIIQKLKRFLRFFQQHCPNGRIETAQSQEPSSRRTPAVSFHHLRVRPVQRSVLHSRHLQRVLCALVFFVHHSSQFICMPFQQERSNSFGRRRHGARSTSRNGAKSSSIRNVVSPWIPPSAVLKSIEIFVPDIDHDIDIFHLRYRGLAARDLRSRDNRK